MRQTFLIFTAMNKGFWIIMLSMLTIFGLQSTAFAKGLTSFSKSGPDYDILIAGVDSVRIPRSTPKQDRGGESKPDIKEVPKSRRQLKPGAVKDRLKTKPVKVPKPKVIKKKIGLH